MKKVFAGGNNFSNFVISVECEIEFFKDKVDNPGVFVDADEESTKKIKVYNQGDQVYIEQEKSYNDSRNIHIGDVFIENQIISSGVTIISNGKTIHVQNGEVTGNEGSKQKAQKIFVYCADNIEKIKAELTKTAKLVIANHVEVVDIELNNSASATIQSVTNVDVNSCNSSYFEIKSLVGDAFINASNSSDVKISGTFNQITVNASNNGSVQLFGDIKGQLTANASNNADIIHRGEVKGKKRTNATNNATIISR